MAKAKSESQKIGGQWKGIRVKKRATFLWMVFVLGRSYVEVQLLLLSESEVIG